MNQSTYSVSSSRKVARAIAHSRAVRARVARRRRRMAALAACLSVALGAPVAWFMAEPAKAIVASAASEARNLADLLGQRSPGARTQAELTKHARVASKVRTSPKAAPASPLDAPSTPALVDLLQPPAVPVSVVAEGSPPPFTPPPTLSEILTSTPIVPSAAPPGDNNGGTAHIPSSEPRENIPPTAVPEPGTWALMLLGFGLIAWRVRHCRSKSPGEPAMREAN